MQIVRIGIADLNHAANAVDGRAQIVAHATQELRLCRVGRRGLTRRLCQLVAIVALLLQQVRQTSTISAATHHHNSGYNTAVEHQHAGSDSRDDLKVALRRGIGVHVEFLRFAVCAQIPLAVDVDQSDFAGQASILNFVDNNGVRRGQVEHAQYGGFDGIGRNDLAIVFDHDIAAIDGFIAIKQALQFECIACNCLRALMPYRDNDTLVILPGYTANVCDRIIRKRDAGGIGLKRMGCHLQHGCLFEIRSKRLVVHAIRRGLGHQIARCVRHDQCAHVELVSILLQRGVIHRAVALYIARYLSGNLHHTNQVFGRISAVERIVGKALRRHVVDNVGKALLGLGRGVAVAHHAGDNRERYTHQGGKEPYPGRMIALLLSGVVGRIDHDRPSIFKNGEGSSKYFDTRRSMVPSASISW